MTSSITTANLPAPADTTAAEPSSTPAPASTETSWLRLAEYGDWPHPRGLQRFTPEAGRAMVRYFKSLRGRLARKFGGLPVYIGHPDDASFSGQSGHTDTRAYAWVTDLQARTDGLYGALKWSPQGEELLRNAFYKFLSPRWVMQPLGKDVFQPVRLLSVGLTNQPNIPGDAIANSAFADTENLAATGPASIAQPLAALPTQPDIPITELALKASGKKAAMPATGLSAAEAANTGKEQTTTHDDEQSPEQTFHRTALCNALGISDELDPLEAIAELREQSDRFYRLACEQSEALCRENNTAANNRREHIELTVQNAVLSGRIAPHEAEQWRSNLEQDWEHHSTSLCTRPLQLKTAAIANARQQVQPAHDTSSLLSRVEQYGKEHNTSFTESWARLKRSNPELFTTLI